MATTPTHILILLLVIFVVNFALPQRLLAQEAAAEEVTAKTALSVDPVISELVIKAGESKQLKVSVFNNTNLPVPIKAVKESFSRLENLEIPADKKEIYDSSTWITLADKDKDFIIQPLAIKTITIDIKVPKDSAPGGHYSTLYFQPLIPQELVSEGSLYIFARVAVIFFFQVPGDIDEKINFEAFNFPKVNISYPIKGNIAVFNNGNTHLRPNIKIKYKDVLTNQEVYVQDLKSSLSLPYIKKSYEFELDKDLGLGIFSAQPVVTYSANNIPLKIDSTTFIVIPPIQTIIFTLLGLVFAVFLFKHKNRFKKAWKVLTKPTTKTNLE